jgi:copper chaperone CopZ
MNPHVKQFILAFALIGIVSIGVEAAVLIKTETVTIQTSAICEKCKERIETALKSLPGVESAILSLSNKKIKVKYDSNKISADNIRNNISKTGYDADNVKADAVAFKGLPSCCQKGGACTGK